MRTHYLPVILILIAAAPHAFAGNVSSSKFDSPFGTAVNDCLAQPGANLLDCAAEAGRRSKSSSVTVERRMNFSIGQPDRNDPPPTEDIVHECGSHFCDVYECYEEDDSSICDFIGQCVVTGPDSADCRIEL